MLKVVLHLSRQDNHRLLELGRGTIQHRKRRPYIHLQDR